MTKALITLASIVLLSLTSNAYAQAGALIAKSIAGAGIGYGVSAYERDSLIDKVNYANAQAGAECSKIDPLVDLYKATNQAWMDAPTSNRSRFQKANALIRSIDTTADKVGVIEQQIAYHAERWKSIRSSLHTVRDLRDKASILVSESSAIASLAREIQAILSHDIQIMRRAIETL